MIPRPPPMTVQRRCTYSPAARTLSLVALRVMRSISWRRQPWTQKLVFTRERAASRRLASIMIASQPITPAAFIGITDALTRPQSTLCQVQTTTMGHADMTSSAAQMWTL